MREGYTVSVSKAIKEKMRKRWLPRMGRARSALGLSSRDSDVVMYQQFRQENEKADAIYQAGEFWKEINADFRDLICAGALQNLRNEYFNRRFAGPAPGSRQVHIALLWLYYQKIMENDHLDFLKSASEPPEGGTTDQEIIHGRAMSLDFLQSIEEAYRILDAWRAAGNPGHPRIITELGGGYGRLAYVCRKMFPDCTYVNIDLPEALTCANSWLGRVLPGEVADYKSVIRTPRLTKERLQQEKLWLLGSQDIERLGDSVSDAFVNVYSLAEMPKEAIANYIRHIDRITTGIFYTKQRKIEKNVFDNVVVNVRDEPLPEHWRLLATKDATLYHDFFETQYRVGRS